MRRGILPATVAISLIVAAIIAAQAASGTRGAISSPIASPQTSPIVSPLPRATVAPWEASVSVADKVTINVTDDEFVPSAIQTTNGHDLTITLINTGTQVHGFRIEEYGIDETLAPSETKHVVIRSPDLGTVAYVSPLPGDEELRGRLTFYI